MKKKYMNFLIFKDVNSFPTHYFEELQIVNTKQDNNTKGSAEREKTCFNRESEKVLFFLLESYD